MTSAPSHFLQSQFSTFSSNIDTRLCQTMVLRNDQIASCRKAKNLRELITFSSSSHDQPVTDRELWISRPNRWTSPSTNTSIIRYFKKLFCALLDKNKTIFQPVSIPLWLSPYKRPASEETGHFPLPWHYGSFNRSRLKVVMERLNGIARA